MIGEDANFVELSSKLARTRIEIIPSSERE